MDMNTKEEISQLRSLKLKVIDHKLNLSTDLNSEEEEDKQLQALMILVQQLLD